MPKRKPNAIDIRLGKNLAYVRRMKKKTLVDVASALPSPMSDQMLLKYEQGKCSLSAGLLVDLAKVLGCKVTDFYEGIADLLPTSGDLQNIRAAADLNRAFVGMKSKEMQQAVARMAAAIHIEVTERMKVKP